MRRLPLEPILWRPLGGRVHEEPGAAAEQLVSFGDRNAEHAAATTAVALVDRSELALLLVQGDDARSFLQGMLTCDVGALPRGRLAWGTVVSGKGRLLAELHVFGLDDGGLLLVLPPSARAGLLEHLQRFLVSERCEVLDVTGALVLLALVGPRAAEAFARAAPGEAPPAEGALRTLVLAGAEVIVAGLGRDGLPGIELAVNPAGAEPVARALLAAVQSCGGTPCGRDALDAARIERFVPRFGVDTTEETIPLEANLDGAISYTKGCYVGQEVIARATYRGAVNKRLVQLAVPAGTQAGAKLLGAERAVGHVTSVLQEPPGGGAPLALGYLRRDHLEVGRSIPLEGGGQATVLRIPPMKQT